LSQANLEQAARVLSKAGATVSDFELPPDSDLLFDRHYVIMGFENARALAWEYENHPDQISATLKPRLDEAWQITRDDYDAVREIARQCRRALAERMRDFDFLLTPSAQSEAPRSHESTGNPVFNRAWTLFGVPCVTVPFGKGAHGLPLGVQLVGPFDGDSALLGWAHWTAAESGAGG
jgi:Asp-tRNA(Asn)/Glu-tRNA(Gln) amidotransferase A subunit family amidase